MKKKELLTEVMGVPKAITFWVEQFSIILSDLIQEMIDEDDFKWIPVTYIDKDGTQKADNAEGDGYNISGKYFNKKVIENSGAGNIVNLLQDERFKSFPLYGPEIVLDVKFLPNELYDLEFKRPYDAVEGSHSFVGGQQMIAEVEDVKIFIKQEFGFTVLLPLRDKENFNKNKVRSIMKPAINHELVHAYELYQKILKKDDPFQGQDTFLNKISKILPKENQQMVNKFMHLIYLHLYFEINARISQLYQEMIEENVSTKEEFMETLKSSSVWNEVTRLEDFDADKYLQELLADFNIEEIKDFIDNWDLILKYMNIVFKEQGLYKGKFMEAVPTEAKENPKVFFKFFENRFRKKAKDFKNKLFRLYDLVINKTLVSENIGGTITCPSCGHDWDIEMDSKHPYLCHMCGYDSKEKEYNKKEMDKFWDEELDEKWSKKYKKSINCNNPKGFSQKAHCAARRKRKAGGKTKSTSPFK